VSILIPKWEDKHSHQAPLTQSRTGPVQGRQDERLLKERRHLTEVVPPLEISEAIWNRWRAQYAGMKGGDIKHLKELESEEAADEAGR